MIPRKTLFQAIQLIILFRKISCHAVQVLLIQYSHRHCKNRISFWFCLSLVVINGQAYHAVMYHLNIKSHLRLHQILVALPRFLYFQHRFVYVLQKIVLRWNISTRSNRYMRSCANKNTVPKMLRRPETVLLRFLSPLCLEAKEDST